MFLSHFVYSCTLLRLLNLLSIYNIIYGDSHSHTDCCICEETPTDSYETSVNSVKVLIQICLGPENLHNSLSLVVRSLPSKIFSRKSLTLIRFETGSPIFAERSSYSSAVSVSLALQFPCVSDKRS